MSKLIFLVIVVLFLSSCSSKNKAETAITEAETEVVEAPLVSNETESREPLYVYGTGAQEKCPTSFVLKLNAAPSLLASSYVRLVGVVSGGKPLALIEVGGRGQCVEVGSEVLDYRIIRMSHNKLYLTKEN